jgi:hypothetical protein
VDSVGVTMCKCIETYWQCRCCVWYMKWYKIKCLFWKAFHFHHSFGICKNSINLGICYVVLVCYSSTAWSTHTRAHTHTHTHTYSGTSETKGDSVLGAFVFYSIN